MQLYPHSSSKDSDMRCDSFMAQLVNVAGIAIAALIFAACITMPLWFSL